jgi:NAD/NADP transhydrogenase alpha subunit
MSSQESLISALYVFALAAFLGYQVISRVPPLLHTPLMSATMQSQESRLSAQS